MGGPCLPRHPPVTFKMAKTAKIGWTNIWIPVLGAFLIWMFGVSPIWVIVAAGFGGFLYGRFIENPNPKL